MRTSLVVGLAGLAGLLAVGQVLGSQQTARDWNPPSTTIDPAYVKAAKALLGKGLNDPRSGTFSKVKIELGNAAWSKQGPVDAYGWCLPGKKVVAVDGLSYPLIEVLSSASPSDLLPEGTSPSSYQPVPVSQVNPALPALLLLAGETKLAEKAFDVVNRSYTEDSSLKLFRHLWNRHKMQIAQGLMSKRDKEALEWSKGLVAIAKVAEELEVPLNSGARTVDSTEATRLRDDLDRRVKEVRKPLDMTLLKSLTQEQRLGELVKYLDEVSTKQTGQPGGLSWFDDPIMRAVASEGQAAVPYLLDVLEKDTRYTRSVSFGRDFFPERTIHTVKSAAAVLLHRAWPSSSSVINSTATDKVSMLRKAWAASEKLTEPERWLAVLRDDAAGPKNWLEAGRYLTKRSDEVWLGGWVSRSDAKNPGMSGDPLKGTLGSEISRLMSQRALTMISNEDQISDTRLIWNTADAMKLGHCLGKWDPIGSVAALKALTKRSLDLVSARQGNEASTLEDFLLGDIATVIADRARAGDESAADDFARLTSAFTYTNDTRPSFFRPMWSSPHDKAMQAVGTGALMRIASNLRAPNERSAHQAIRFYERAISSSMLRLPAFRRILSESLNATQMLGEAWLEKSESSANIRYKIGENSSGGIGITGIEGLPPVGQHTIFSPADMVCQYITRLPQAPKFCLLWPQAQRDQARGEVQMWLLDAKVDWDKVLESTPFFHEDD